MIAHILLTLALVGADPKADLEGTYMTMAGEENGKALSEDHVKNTSVVIHKGWLTVYKAKTGEQMDFQYRLTPGSQGGGIDMKVVGGPEDGKVSHGIYETDGERLRITFFQAGDSRRPARFDTKGNEGQMMFEMRNVAK